MCRYCNKEIMENDSMIPIILNNFLLFGETFMEIFSSLGLDEDGNVQEEIYLSGSCIASQKINYCPFCGRSLKE